MVINNDGRVEFNPKFEVCLIEKICTCCHIILSSFRSEIILVNTHDRLRCLTNCDALML